MEKRTAAIGIGIGLLALALAAPFAYARMMGGNGLSAPGYGMMGFSGGNWQAQQPAAFGAGQQQGYGMMGYAPASQQAPAESQDGWYGAMAQMHNRLFGTSYNPEEFQKLHEGIGCH